MSAQGCAIDTCVIACWLARDEVRFLQWLQCSVPACSQTGSGWQHCFRGLIHSSIVEWACALVSVAHGTTLCSYVDMFHLSGVTVC